MAQRVVAAGVGALARGRRTRRGPGRGLRPGPCRRRRAHGRVGRSTYGAHGETEALIACAFVADALCDLAARTSGREAAWGVGPAGWHRRPTFVAALPGPAIPGRAGRPRGDRGISTPTSSWCARPSTASPRSRSARGPSTSTAPTPTSPRRSSPAWPRWAGFGLSVPEEYGGFATGGESDYIGHGGGHRGALVGLAGRRGLARSPGPRSSPGPWSTGGTEEQKQHWLPRLATAEIMGAVAVTEPDFGSDVAGVVTSGDPDRGWVAHQRREDLVHLRGAGRRADAAGPDRSRPVQGPPGAVALPGGEAPGRGARLPVRPGARPGRPAGRLHGPHGGAGHRHPRLPRDALLRGGLRELVRPRRQPGRRRGGPGAGLLPPDAGLRERPAADGGPGHRGHAGRLRGRTRLRRATGWCSARRSSTTS